MSLYKRDSWLLLPSQNMASKANILSVCALALVIMTGCEVGPNYTRPKVDAPSAFKSESPATQPAQPIPADWWRLYDDPQLDQLIVTANESNQNLRQAVARVDQARALAHVAATFLLPTVTANPSFSHTLTSANKANAATKTDRQVQ